MPGYSLAPVKVLSRWGTPSDNGLQARTIPRDAGYGTRSAREHATPVECATHDKDRKQAHPQGLVYKPT